MNGSVTVVPSQSPGKEDSSEGEVDSTLMKMKEQGRILEAQMEDRPLAKEQEKLNDGTNTNPSSVVGKEDRVKEGSTSASASESDPEEEEEIEQRALLTNDDNELERVEAVLMEVHKQYFHAYDLAKDKGLVQDQAPTRIDYDVTVSVIVLLLNTWVNGYLSLSFRKLSRRYGRELFRDFICCSPALFPLIRTLRSESIIDGRFCRILIIDRSEVWRLARLYGAICHSDLNSAVTHVVAAKVRIPWFISPCSKSDSLVAWDYESRHGSAERRYIHC